ncbi:MAG: shikimate kinase, partial [Pseudomonadota bacterium]
MRAAADEDLRLRLRRPVALIGLMGCGKSTVGARLAKLTNAPFRDADAEIERAAGMSIPEIFDRLGEPAFRDGERRVIARLLAEGPMVIATGGGAFMAEETRRAVAAAGAAIWLEADLDTLVERTARRSS